MSKQTVIERMRAAEQWLGSLYGPKGAPYGWLRELIIDAMQEMESESGRLWMQTVTGRHGHVRIFVQGDMGARELDLLLEVLQLHRSWCREDERLGAEPTPADAADTKVGE